jgi:hypothetical protein
VGTRAQSASRKLLIQASNSTSFSTDRKPGSGGVRVKVTGAVDPVAITAAIGAVMKARRRR